MRPKTTRRRSTGWRGQLSLFLAVYVVYNLARWLFVGDLDAASQHARGIVALEQSAGVAIERPIAAGESSPSWTRLLSYSYLARQHDELCGALIWLYRRSESD